MSSFTTKTVQPLEPGVSGVALDSVGIAHETAQAFGATLEDLAMLAYRRGKARFKLKLSTASTAGAATVRFWPVRCKWVQKTLPLAARARRSWTPWI